ncbi:MAG: hypothetical protein QMD53_02170 [Actinomycetota bacterium]|nr:hypothetical protein [Actinomycetota bacterium]
MYTPLLIFVIYGLKEALGGGQETDFLAKIGPLFIVSSLANVSWIFAWHFEKVALSLLIMLVILASLIVIYLRLGTGASQPSKGEALFVRPAFSIYLGWISVATIANVSVLLLSLGWNGFGISAESWTVLMIAAATILGLLAVKLKGDIFYALAIYAGRSLGPSSRGFRWGPLPS